MDILVIDNYDSFTYNLVHMLETLPDATIVVKRNDQFELGDVERFHSIVLSPGPGVPSEAGLMPQVVREFAPTKNIFGVCLGHQCIGEIFGGELYNLPTPIHGKAFPMTVTQPEDRTFRGLPQSFTVGRYHSWVVKKDNFPSALEITAIDDSGEVMALRHKTFNVRGVQFHPESILTQHGYEMLKNVVLG